MFGEYGRGAFRMLGASFELSARKPSIRRKKQESPKDAMTP